MNHLLNSGIGDVLKRKKAGGLINHYCVLVGPGQIVQNTPEKGEHLATLAEFATGQPVEVIRTGANPREVIARAQRILANPKRYDSAFRNCEHTVWEIVEGRSQSPQFAARAVLCAGLALLLALRR